MLRRQPRVALDDGSFVPPTTRYSTPCALNDATHSLKSRLRISSDPFVVAAQLFDGGNALSNGARKPIPQIVAGLVLESRDAHGGFHQSAIVASMKVA
jgi:hypothetical protein